MKLDRIVPAAGWLRDYRAADLPGDLLASVIVTVMLIPQGLAYAMLANLPPAAGLYASVVPVVAYALFGSSRTLAVGPVAVASLMTATAVSRVAAPGSPEYVAAVLAVALLGGLFLLVMGLLRLGFIANLLSHPVISGFISASAILIAINQLKHLLGVPASGERLDELVHALAVQLPNTNLPTLAIGAASIAALMWSRRALAPLLARVGMRRDHADLAAKAAPVVVIVVVTAIVAFFDLERRGVRIIGELPAGLPPLSMPPIDIGLWRELLAAAVLIGLVNFVESVSVAQSLAAKRRQKVDPNRELMGLGAANTVAAFTGGFPVAGGFSRSVVNFAAGANTQLASILTALLVAIAAAFLTPWFYYMPQAVLAATIMVAVLGLVDLRTLAHTWHYDRADAASLIVTALTVLIVGVEAGIVAGVGLSLALYIWRTSRPHLAIVGRVPGTEHYRNVRRHDVLTDPQVLALRVDENLYFVNARWLEDRVTALVAENPEVRDVVLICSAVNMIDASALESLEMIERDLDDAGVTLHLAEVKGPVMDRLARAGFLDRLSGRVFLSTHAAMCSLAQRPNADPSDAAEPTADRDDSPSIAPVRH